MSAYDGAASVRSLSEISEEETVRITVDLVAAARRNLGFLKFIAESPWFHQTPALLESIRRFFISLLTSTTLSSSNLGIYFLFFFSFIVFFI